MQSFIDVATLSRFSRGVEDNNHNGIFDEGDVLKGYSLKCQGSARDACGCYQIDSDYVLTAEDTASTESFKKILWTALNRRARFYDEDGKSYMGLSRTFSTGCVYSQDNQEEYIIEMKPKQ